MTPEQRRLRAKIAANTRWSRPMTREDASDVARSAFYARLARQVDPQGRLTPAELDRRVQAAARAFSARLNAAKARNVNTRFPNNPRMTFAVSAPAPPRQGRSLFQEQSTLRPIAPNSIYRDIQRIHQPKSSRGPDRTRPSSRSQPNNTIADDERKTQPQLGRPLFSR
jgi:hypothetical protein